MRWGLLVYKPGLLTIFYVFGTLFLFAVMLWMSVYWVIWSFITTHYLLSALGVLLVMWILANLILMNKLVKIEGGVTINFFESMVKPGNPKFRFSKNGEGVYRYTRSYTLTNWPGVCWTVLKQDDVLLVNKTTLLRYDMLSPFHGLYNYLKCRKIARRLRELKAEQAKSKL